MENTDKGLDWETLAGILISNIDPIVDGWVTDLRKRPHTSLYRRLGTRKITANIQALLYALASALTPGKLPSGAEPKKDLFVEAIHLGELRQAQGFEIGDLVEGYAALRRQIWQLLIEQLRGKESDMLDLGERLHQVVDFALETSVQTFHEIERDDLLERSSTDSLTGLYNHAHFWGRLGQEISRAKRYNHPIAVLMIDIDDFKGYNDLFGHVRGDLALIEIAEILQNEHRTSDIAARYGGEEFAIILPEAVAPDAHKVAERIRKAIAAHGFVPKEARHQHLTVSIGCAATEGEHVSPKDLVEAADYALYEAKEEGKNKTYTYLCKSGQRIRF